MEPDGKRRYTRIGPARAGRNTPLAERLARRGVRQPNGCLEYNGARYPPPHLPYGSITVNGKTKRVHVVAWVLVNGPVLPGKIIRHTCDNPPCFEESHLLPGTRQDNARDCVERGREPDIRGERNPFARFTAAQVASIRARIAGGERQADIAREFNVHRTTISKIWTRKNWA